MRLGCLTYNDVLESARQLERDYQSFQERGDSPYYIPDYDLGWTISPDSFHPGENCSSDSDGFRPTSEYAPRQNAKKLCLVGDSIAFGAEVSDQESWPWLLSDQLGPDWHVINAAVSAYGTDQSYLRFKKSAEKRAINASILAITTTDLYRNLNICRTFIAHQGGFPFLKPRFILKDQELCLISSPSADYETVVQILTRPETMEHLRLYDRFYPSLRRQCLQIARYLGLPLPSETAVFFKEAVALVIAIARRFVDDCRNSNIEPIILLLPIFRGSYPTGRDFDCIQTSLEKENCLLLDGRRVFTHERLAMPDEMIYCPRNHYSPLSSQWIAEWLAGEVRSAL